MNENVIGLVLAGGKGTRLFPISHPGCPKQFCQLDKNNTFIQAAVENLKAVGVKPTRIFIVTTDDNQTELAKSQCLPRGVLSQNILQLNPHLGYAGAMVEAANIIYGLYPDAAIINTPSDQYVYPDESFHTAINNAVCSANDGNAVIVGVKINDIVTAMGCGHAIYTEDGDAHECYNLTGFVEKPNREEADKLMRQGNSVCNTGINVWRADTVKKAFESHRGWAGPLYIVHDTDELMGLFKSNGILKVSVGTFNWYDCGTLKSLYEISKKTPNHKNASIGGGTFERNDCRRCLLYVQEGMELRVSGAEDTAVVFAIINDDRPIVVVAKLSDSQKIKLLAEDYMAHEEILNDDFSMGARNNIVLKSNISDEVIVCFVGVRDYAVYVHKRISDGTLEAVVSQQLIPNFKK